MRYSILTTITTISALASAAIIPNSPRSVESPVEDRQLVTALITAALTAAATEIGTEAAKGAIEASVSAINELKADWDEARQQFTQQTTLNMWNANPDPANFIAVACYNKGYAVQDQANIHGLVSAEIKMGLLNTDYDCMYISGPNAFWTHSDGGFQNLCYRFDDARCSYDGETGDLNCS